MVLPGGFGRLGLRSHCVVELRLDGRQRDGSSSTADRNRTGCESMPARVVSAYAEALFETAERAGLARAELLNFGAVSMPLSGEGWPVTDYLRLLNAAAERLPDPAFGLHVGEQFRLSHYAVYGLMLLACRNFREAMMQVMRYETLAHDLGQSELVEHDALAEYRWHSPWLAEHACRHLPESVFAGIAVFVHWLAGQPVAAREVCFQHAAPADTREHERIFACPVRFDCRFNSIVFDRAILELPVPQADPSLRAALQQHADQLLAARREQTEPEIVGRGRAIIVQQLGQGRAKLPDVAARLAMSPRSLQRQLERAGYSFQQLLDNTRRELAAQYLRDPRLSLTDIAFLLGYSEQSSFTHAFRDWEGMTPSQWRAESGRS